MTFRRGELESMAGVFSRSEQTEREKEWNRQSSWKRHEENGRKKAGRLIFRGRPTNLEREREREGAKKRERIHRGRMVDRWTRSAVRRLPIGKILQFDYNFFRPLAHTEPRKNLKPVSPTTRNTFVERDRWAWVARGWRRSGAGRKDVKLISRLQSFLKAFESAI